MEDELRELYQLKQEVDDHVDMVEGDIWGNSQWHSLMSRLLKYDENASPGNKWPQTITWDADELRELLKEVEAAMMNNMMEVYLPLMAHLNNTIGDMDYEFKSQAWALGERK